VSTHASEQPLLSVERLSVVYPRRRRSPALTAVDDVSFSIAPGETVGLVGESGSGKSSIGRAILGLAPVTRGSIRLDDRDITHATGRERMALSADIQAVFQDPYSSLNPVRTVGQTLSETLRAAPRDRAPAGVGARVGSVLESVGLPKEAAARYPTHFSGGQRQRIAIARAIIASPRLVICDEPVSALDLSIQAQILNLLREMQHDLGLSMLFISHDLAVVRYMSNRIMVMSNSMIVESGDASEVYSRPRHPYTGKLLAAANSRTRRRQQRPLSAPTANTLGNGDQNLERSANV
jgi:ABC-type oligopeptide transport system ATPase subunit